MEDKNKKDISRRNFIKALGAGTVVTAASMYGCKPNNTVLAESGAIGEVPTTLSATDSYRRRNGKNG